MHVKVINTYRDIDLHSWFPLLWRARGIRNKLKIKFIITYRKGISEKKEDNFVPISFFHNFVVIYIQSLILFCTVFSSSFLFYICIKKRQTWTLTTLIKDTHLWNIVRSNSESLIKYQHKVFSACFHFNLDELINLIRW